MEHVFERWRCYTDEEKGESAAEMGGSNTLRHFEKEFVKFISVKSIIP